MNLITRLQHVYLRKTIHREGYEVFHDTELVDCEPSRADYVSSRRVDGKGHMLLLDLDRAAELYDSRQKNHHHLVVDTNLTWRQYKRILRVLANANVVDPAWVDAQIPSHAGFLRINRKTK